MNILDIKDLSLHFRTDYGTVKALDGVSVSVEERKTLGIVGESGCGKTVLALSIMRLVPIPPGKIVSGTINFNGLDLLSIDEERMRKMRGREISMIFQEPITSLNPVLTVGEQIAEAIRLHEGVSNKEAINRSIELLKLVGMPSPAENFKRYPHQMSGGMSQRVMIAMAVSCRPRLLLADEPTTALDVTIQAQIIDLIDRIREQAGTSIVLITHDLGVVAEVAHQIAVMYAGKVVEYGSVIEVFETPYHPYTIGLMESIPKINDDGSCKTHLKTIPGVVPAINQIPSGCRFHDRCFSSMKICKEQEPSFHEKSKGHFVACWLHI